MPRRQRKADEQIKPCPQCQRVFAARANAEYCSPKCRKAAWRDKGKQKVERLHALVVTLAREAGLWPEDFN